MMLRDCYMVPYDVVIIFEQNFLLYELPRKDPVKNQYRVTCNLANF